MTWLALVMAANVALSLALIRTCAGDAVRASRLYVSRDHRDATSLTRGVAGHNCGDAGERGRPRRARQSRAPLGNAPRQG